MRNFLQSLVFVAAMVIALGALSGCVPDDTTVEPVVYDAEVSIRLDEIGATRSHTSAGEMSTISFFVFIDRTGLGGLLEPNTSEGDTYYSDLPASQQVTYFYAKKDPTEEYGTMCYAPTAPHKCEVDEAGTYTLEIMFEDGGFAVATVEVPEPEMPEVPLILAPFEVPEQGALASMTFQAIGAEEYEATINLCEEYQNDGINPCLSGQNFNLIREGEDWDWQWEEPKGASFALDEEAQTFTLSSGWALDFGVSVQYQVCGTATGVRDDGIKTYWESCDFVEFFR